MKFHLNNKYVRWGLTAFFVIAAGICFYYLIFHGSNIKAGFDTIVNILMPVVFGLATAYLLTPILNHIEYRILIPLCNKCKIKETAKREKVIRVLSIIITAFLFFAVISGLISMMLSQIVPSIMNIVSNFDSYITNFTKWLNKLLSDYPEIGENVIKMVNKYSDELEKWLNDSVFTKTSEVIKTVSLSVIGVLKVLWNFIIGFIISIYVLASKEKFAGQAKKIIYAIFDKDIANIVINNLRFTHRTFIGFISGKVFDSLIIGILCFIGTSILKTPYAALVSVIVGVTNVIPFFGPYLGAIPSTILIFMIDPMHPLNCVYFVIFILILQQFDGNFLGPRILGNSTGLTGFWVIFAITLFGGLFGVMGMIVGVPIFAVIYAAVRSFVNASLQKKNIPQESEIYINVAAIDGEGIHEYVPDYKLKRTERNKTVYGTEFLCSTGNVKSIFDDESSGQTGEAPEVDCTARDAIAASHGGKETSGKSTEDQQASQDQEADE